MQRLWLDFGSRINMQCADFVSERHLEGGGQVKILIPSLKGMSQKGMSLHVLHDDLDLPTIRVSDHYPNPLGTNLQVAHPKASHASVIFIISMFGA